MRKVKYLALIKATKAATNQGGAARTSVTVRLNPSVAVRVGKKALNDKAVTSEVNAMLNHQTFQSDTANQRPRKCLSKKLLLRVFELLFPLCLLLILSLQLRLSISLRRHTRSDVDVFVSSWSPILIPPSSSIRLRARDLS